MKKTKQIKPKQIKIKQLDNKNNARLARGKPRNKKELYVRVSCHAMRAIEILVYEMVYGDNSNARIGAAKTLLNKIIPDLRTTELTGKDGNKLQFIISKHFKND